MEVKKGTGFRQLTDTRPSGSTQNRDRTQESSCADLSKMLRHMEEAEITP